MEHTAPRLQYFPVSWFATVMGLSGLSIAWNRAEHFFNPGFCLSSLLLGLTSLWFFLLIGIYATKIAKYPAEVRAELTHPVKQAFAPTFSISLLLLSVAYLQSAREFSFWLWAIGTICHLGFTFYILSSWMHHTKYEIAHLNPALFIFIAPPAVGFISWFNLTGSIDAFGHILYSVAAIFTLLLFSQINHFRRIPFFLSWWAYSFPLAAMTIATFLMAKITGQAMYLWLGAGLLGLLSALIAMLVWRTARAVARRQICVPGH